MIKQGRSFSGNERNCSFLNTGASPSAAQRFATISSSSGIDFPDDGRALVPVDWDHDGDLDLWISARNAPRVRFLRNDSPPGNTFLSIKLIGNGVDTNRDAIGARIEVVTTPRDGINIQSLRAGEGFLSQESKWIHFGLNQVEKIDRVIVHWPGGNKETFSGIEANSRYTLRQGNKTPLLWSSREVIAIEDSDPIIPGVSLRARIPLLTRLPKTTLDFVDFQGNRKQYFTGLGKATLVTLWAGWCPTCKLELTEFTERFQDFKDNNIDVLALNVDGLGDDRSDLAAAQKLLGDIRFPFQNGKATPQLVNEFQELHDLVIPLKHPLPVPTSFLIDATGRLSLIYKGQVKVDDIIKDAQLEKANAAMRLKLASPLKGRTINEPLVDRVFLENQARALFYFGTRLLDRKQAEEAIYYYLDALAIKPDSFKAHYNIGLAYRMTNNIGSALYHFNEAVQHNPDLYSAHQMLGELLMRQGRYDEAQKHFLNQLHGNPKNAVTLTSLGVLAANLGNFTEAENRFSQAITVSPNFIEAQYNLAALLLSQRQNSRAETLFLSLATTNPDYPDIHYNLGVIYETRKEMKKALRFYMEELRLKPNSVKTLTAIGRLMEQKKDHLQASKFFSRAVTIQPNFSPAQEGLARLRKKR